VGEPGGPTTRRGELRDVDPIPAGSQTSMPHTSWESVLFASQEGWMEFISPGGTERLRRSSRLRYRLRGLS
jgi:hypothetical protein